MYFRNLILKIIIYMVLNLFIIILHKLISLIYFYSLFFIVIKNKKTNNKITICFNFLFNKFSVLCFFLKLALLNYTL
jgi:hypothetical protein